MIHVSRRLAAGVYSKPFRTPREFIDPVVKRSLTLRWDPYCSIMKLSGWGLFFTTYGIIANWIYDGFVDLWDGTYGTGDDDDDD